MFASRALNVENVWCWMSKYVLVRAVMPGWDVLQFEAQDSAKLLVVELLSFFVDVVDIHQLHDYVSVLRCGLLVVLPLAWRGRLHLNWRW